MSRAGTAWIALAIVAGCSSNEATSVTCAPATPSDSCASYDGPRQTGELPFEAGATTPCAQCLPRCGVPRTSSGELSAAALPSGSCTGSATCDLGARLVCACAEARGPLNGYRCTCEAGQWRCRVISQGGSICMNDVCDAGADG